jgi:tripartite-type tricarboxylate transporter receptor subunit TctC
MSHHAFRPASALTRRSLVGGALTAPLVIAAGARAQGAADWPARTVTFVEGYPPGGLTDVTSRIVAERMGKEIGGTIIVENRPGSATSIAATAVARAQPDGHTLLMGTTTLAINRTLQPHLTPQAPDKELAPIGMVFRTAFILHVHPSLPVTTVGELVAHCKANPGKVVFGSPGVGSVSHLCLEIFRAQAGIDVMHVPYRGGGGAALDLQAGRIHAVFQGVQEAMAFLQAGNTRGLGVSVKSGVPLFPNLPAILDTVPGFGEVTFWQGLFAPAGTPAPVIAKAGAALRKTTDDPEIRTRMTAQGIDMVTGDAEMLRDTLASETQRWGDLIRTANIRLG